MATFRSIGHTVFREGDPAVPDIAAEKRGVPPTDRSAPGKASAAVIALDGPLAVELRQDAKRRGLSACEVMEEAARLYLAGRREV